MNNNIILDLDKNIVSFVEENITNKDAFNGIKLEEYINKIIEFALNDQKVTADKIYISIQSASKEEIKKINKEYRNIDKETDVLSFPIFDVNEIRNISEQKDESKKLKEIELGDIILCLDVIKLQSIMYNTGILRETLYMITHGVCHLLGFDHIKEEDKVVMRNLEEKILSYLGVEK